MQHAALTVALALLLAPAADSAVVSFERIADATTPGTSWDEFVYFSPPAVHAGRVAFHALSPSGSSGTYLAHGGGITAIAVTGMPIPGGGTFLNFYASPAVRGDDVVFVGSDAGGLGGVYAWIGGVLSVVADATTLEPGSGTPLGVDARGPSFDAGELVFRAYDGTGWAGAYRWTGGVLSTAVDESSVLPGGAGSTGLHGRPALESGAVAFAATDPVAHGLYVADAAGLRAVFDQGMALPGSAGPGGFVEGDPSFRGGSIAFEAGSGDRLGIYAEQGGVLQVVADDTTLLPGSGEAFAWFGGPSYGGPAADGDTVAFIGGSVFGPAGLYARHRGELMRLLDANASLDGKPVSGFEIGPDAVHAGRIAFRVHFADATHAVYLATLPAPAVPGLPAGWAFALALALLAGARSRLARS